MAKTSNHRQRDNSLRASGKTGTQQRVRDKLGPNSGPMGTEDQRKDKFGSRHNQDANGLLSDETQIVRKEMAAARQKLARRKKNRTGSR
jgi:hypothetical protein